MASSIKLPVALTLWAQYILHVHRLLSTTAPKEFNRLSQYTSIMVARPTATQNLLFSFLAVALTIVSIHHAYTQWDGQAQLAPMVGYIQNGLLAQTIVLYGLIVRKLPPILLLARLNGE